MVVTDLTEFNNQFMGKEVSVCALVWTEDLVFPSLTPEWGQKYVIPSLTPEWYYRICDNHPVQPSGQINIFVAWSIRAPDLLIHYQR
jgi:hypothetical protein